MSTDRRTTSVLGALLCYLTRRFLFPDANMDVVQAVDFDVMILLSSIMVINHIVVHLKETKDVIDYLQRLVNEDPVRGLWVISLAAFMASPFLTNDGVCLLFVEPILNAFEQAPFASELTDGANIHQNGRLVLRKEDALYFLLALACSANIGSALTYTGNPQNMIVASDSLRVLPSYKFFIYILPASLFAWLASKKRFQSIYVEVPLIFDNVLYSNGIHSQMLDIFSQSACSLAITFTKPLLAFIAQSQRAVFWTWSSP